MEWARAETRAEIIPATALRPARVEFTGREGGTRRRRSVAVGAVDVDPRLLVETVNGPTGSTSPVREG